MIIAEILKKSIEMDASDIILTSWAKPAFKIYGDIFYLEEYEKFFPSDLNKNLLSIMNELQREEFKNNMELDFPIDLKWFCRFRVNAFLSKNGIWAVFRPIKTKLPTYRELWLPSNLLDLIKKKNGLLLVTGAVWSWKSTTLSALIDVISANMKKHIVTIEDPVEYVFNNNKSLIEQREVGVNTKSFENGLKYALRQASDVIMIWEMRDLETFRLALRAAETGNLVLATLHTSGAARTVSRIVDMFPWEEKENIRAQLADSLIWVIWQDLLKKKDWSWRVLATELLVNNTSISNMIRKWVLHQIDGAIETWASDGMYTMKNCLEELKRNWII